MGDSINTVQKSLFDEQNLFILKFSDKNFTEKIAGQIHCFFENSRWFIKKTESCPGGREVWYPEFISLSGGRVEPRLVPQNFPN